MNNNNLSDKKLYCGYGTILLCFAAFQPGSGKSTLSNFLLNYFSEHGYSIIIIRSDDFKYIINGKQEFEEEVIEHLASGKYNIVIYDKNIPNINGYKTALAIVSKARKKSKQRYLINCVPIVPGLFTENDATLCIQRVMMRKPESQALTASSVFTDYDSVEEFTRDVFSNKCIEFVSKAKELENAIVLTEYSFSDKNPGIDQLKTFL
jgi:hypothetical protein